jgi:fibronectin type 3 domain-containing protein
MASLAPFKGGIAKIDIVNALGQTVYESTTSVSKSTFEVALPATIANGVYMLKLTADGMMHHARFTVSR